MSVSTSCLRFIALLFVCIVYVSANNVDSVSNYQYDESDNDGEFKFILPSDILFFLKNINVHSGPTSTVSDSDLQSEQAHMIPFKKRTIPIELQKALYAHGIVGRRR
jgi:hypothetical protein